MGNTCSFWRNQAPHSLAKTEIAVGYFRRWANIMKCRGDSLTYLDLFSGRGLYEDGTKSTPLRILDEVSKDSTLCQRLRIHFHEKDPELRAVLESAVRSHPSYGFMTHKPEIIPDDINPRFIDGLQIRERTFSFIDPWGYKGISLDLVSAVLHKWGNDCLFYISIPGVRRNLEIAAQQADLVSIFNSEGLARLKQLSKPHDRKTPFHEVVTVEIERAIQSRYQRRVYVLPFAIESERNATVTHYLIFLCKHPLGFDIMKSIMADQSLITIDGEPAYRWRRLSSPQTLPFPHQFSKLQKWLLAEYSGKTIPVRIIVERYHASGGLATTENLHEALMKMRDEEKVIIKDPYNKRRRKNTLADELVVTFP